MPEIPVPELLESPQRQHQAQVQGIGRSICLVQQQGFDASDFAANIPNVHDLGGTRRLGQLKPSSSSLP